MVLVSLSILVKLVLLSLFVIAVEHIRFLCALRAVGCIVLMLLLEQQWRPRANMSLLTTEEEITI